MTIIKDTTGKATPFGGLLVAVLLNFCGSISSQTATRFVCPMHSDQNRGTSGVCPVCGMALMPVGVEESLDPIPDSEKALVEYAKKLALKEQRHLDPGSNQIISPRRMELCTVWPPGDGGAALVKLLQSERLANVGNAAFLIGEMGYVEAVPALRGLLESGKITPVAREVSPELWYARLHVAIALHRMGDSRGLPVLEGMLCSPVGAEACMGLAERDGKEVQVLLRKCEADGDQILGSTARAGQVGLGNMRKWRELEDAEWSKNERLAFWVVRCLGNNASDEALRELREIVVSEEYSQELRLLAARGLAIRNDEAMLKYLIGAADGGADLYAWALAAEAIGEVGGRRHIKFLRRAMLRDSETRFSAAKALISLSRRL